MLAKYIALLVSAALSKGSPSPVSWLPRTLQFVRRFLTLLKAFAKAGFATAANTLQRTVPAWEEGCGQEEEEVTA